MIKTFDDFIKENKNNQSGIQTFDDFIKSNGYSITNSNVSSLRTNFENEKKKYGNITLNIANKKKEIASDNLTKQGINFNNTGYYLPEKNSKNNLFNNNAKKVDDAVNRNNLIMNELTNAENRNEIKQLRNEQKKQESNVGWAQYNYNKQRIDEEKVTNYDKSLGRVFSGVLSNLSAISQDYATYDENGKRVYLPSSAQMKEQKVSESYNTKFGKFLGDVANQGARIGSSTLLNGVLPGVGTTLYWSSMFDNSYKGSLQEGYGKTQSLLYASTSTAMEYLTGKFLGSATKGLTGGKSSELSEWVKSGVEKISKSKLIQNFFANATSEATEEFLQEYIDTFSRNVIFKENNKVFSKETFENALYSAAIGAVTGGILGGDVETEEVLNSKNGLNNNIETETNIDSEIENKPTTKQITNNHIDNNTSQNIAHTSSNVVQNLNQNENITEGLEKLRKREQLNNQNKKIENIENKINEYKESISKQNYNLENDIQNTSLSLEEQNELISLKEVPFDLDTNEIERLNYLENKKEGKIKYADLTNKTSYESIKTLYEKYKNLNDFNPALYNNISETVPSYRNTGKRTMNEWLGLAKQLGVNFKGDSNSLEKYAIQSWFYAKPNTKENLNMQGNKYVKFTLSDWLKSFYEGAGVENEVSSTPKTNVDNQQTNYSMSDLPMSSYAYAESNNAKINELRKSASQYLNNSNKTINTMNLLEKIISDKDYRIRFNPDITNENGVSVNGLIAKENGQITIELNPNSNSYVEFLIVHEITHDIATKEMKQLILDYAKQDSNFEKSLESLKERYKTNDVSDEVVADVCGELFGNREFIQSVVEKKPNIFKKILNNIRNLAKKIKGTGANEYVNFVEKLKTMWEEAYYVNESNLGETRYSTIGLKGAKNLSKNNNTREYKNLFNRQKQAEDIHSNSTDTLDNTNIRSKRETGWYKTKYGDWGTLISDKEAKLIKTLEPNKTYKLGEILKHDLLYQAYPMLRKLKVKTADLSSSGAHSSIKWLPANNITNEIFLNNNDISKKDFKNTLLHEINHFIEHKEKYNKMSRGTNTKIETKDNYLNNLGEIISNETKINSNLTQNELNDIILPEQAKSKPEYKNIKEKLIKSNQKDTKTSAGVINALQNLEIPIQNEIKNNKVADKKHNKYSRINEDLGELDNSSFSFKQNIDEWNDYLKENFPSSGTKTKMSDINLPTREDIQNSNRNNKALNPNEISKLTKEDANTTPKLPKRKNINKFNDGDSNFVQNIKNKVNMLNKEQKDIILSEKDIKFYDKVTNRESLEKAFKKINDGGLAETIRWSTQDSKNINATDVAEGWILLKQYADNGDYDSMIEIAKKMREIGTTAGQTVQAFNIMERMTPEGMVKYAQSELSEAYDKMVKNKTKEWIDKYRTDFDLKPDEVQFIMENMKEIQNMEDGYDKRVKLAEIQKLMTDKLPPEKGAKIKSWMRMSMLFNPKTQVRNVAGNALIMPINSFGDLFSSYADKLIAKKTGVRTTGTTNIKAMIEGIKRGAYEATNDYKKGINTKDMEGNRFEISNGKSFSEKNLMGKTLNRTESLLNYVMDVGDRVFSEAAFENSLQNQLILNNTTEITQEMIDIAHQEALSRTWNDNNNYTRFVLGVRAGINKLASFKGYGLGDVLIPFAKTPANLTKAIVDYSPVGLVNTINKGINLKNALTNGQFTATMQHEFVQSLGKATAGTMLYILGIALAKAGITGGKSDDDKDTANFLKNTLGISSYSIKIGNKSFTYDWAQPLAAPLSITANVINSKNSSSKALLEGIIGSLDTAGSILLEQSFLSSINDVLSDNDGVVSGIINEVLELPARAVPTFSKQIADLVDGTQRTSFEYNKPIKSAINSIKAKIPFVSKTLNPSIDTMGREIQKYGGKNNVFNVFLNPANINTKNISKSAEEIYRLYKETGENDVMPRVAPYYINQKGKKIMISGKERVEYQKTSGKIIEDNVKKLLSDTSYLNMSDIEKANVVKNIVNYSYNIAKKDVLGLELSNAYEKAYEYSKIGNIGDYYTFKESIDDTNKDTKKESITNFLINSDLNNEQLTYLYGNYYSSEKVLNTLLQANIPIKEYIKFNSKVFENDYYDNGKIITNSRKNKVISYINGLNLTIPQKAMLIKMEYNSYKQYDNKIVNYVNSINCSAYDKKIILKTIGFSNYDKDIIGVINSKNMSISQKTKELKDLGFQVYTKNGKTYVK